MSPLINLISLIASSVLFISLYIISVGPAAMEKKIGPKAYQRCGAIRSVSMIFMFIALANYILYNYYPLAGLNQFLPWPRWISTVIAVILAIPTTYFVVKGMMDAGKEMAVPQRDGEMYGGIYQHIRHPQAWEAVYFFVIAFALHSPFLVIYSLIWLPAEYAMMRAEERDLVLRFGESYENYLKEVGMFWPKQTRSRG